MAAVDRLSSLPPELLADVFGLAAEHSTPLKEPLSRTLLPYFRETLYRRVHFASEKSLSRFAAAILAQSFLGLLVRELRAPTGWPRVEHHARNTGLVHHLTRLLYLDNVTFEFDAIHFSSFSRLSQLRSLSYKCTGLGPRHLEQLVHLVSLTSLEIRFFTTDACELESARFGSLELPQVTHLSLKCLDTWLEDTRNSWDRHFARFVDRFPRLESLTLDDVRMPRFSGILGHLSIATQTLKSLVLRSPASGPALPSYRCDHFLPRFRHLELVDLCQHTVSHALGIFLAQLPELAFLRLGPNTHFDIDAQALVATIGDPRQTPSLQLFKFDAIWGAYGKPLQPDAVQFFTLRGDGWVEPRLGEWELDDLHRLDEVAQ
ncbi:hypothetical protein JCM3766R1_001873 [Sporobolomyces carnicolor]